MPVWAWTDCPFDALRPSMVRQAEAQVTKQIHEWRQTTIMGGGGTDLV
jgi:hypothetical protein